MVTAMTQGEKGTDVFAPGKLTLPQRTAITEMLQGKTAGKVIRLILEKGPAHFNRIHEAVGGSRTSLARALERLLDDSLLQSSWQTLYVDNPEPGHTRPVYARVFDLKDPELRKLLEYYLPLINE